IPFSSSAFAVMVNIIPKSVAINLFIRLTLSLAAPRQWRPVDGRQAGNVLQRLVRSRFTRWFPVLLLGSHANAKEAPHRLAIRHRYKPPDYPARLEFSANCPTTWADCR